MRYKLVFGAGFAAGYYAGAKAGRERYEQIQRQLLTLRHHPRVEAVADRISNTVHAQVDKAKDVVATTVKSKVDSVVETARSALPGDRAGDRAGNADRQAGCNGNIADGSPHGTATIPQAVNPR